MTVSHRALADEIERIARADTLLVCLDFDGTICELSPDAYAVTPNPEALRAARTLMALPGTQVAVLSGRHLEGLRRVVGLEKPVMLVGSHGAETTAGAPQLAPADRAYLDDIARQLEAIATPLGLRGVQALPARHPRRRARRDRPRAGGGHPRPRPRPG